MSRRRAERQVDEEWAGSGPDNLKPGEMAPGLSLDGFIPYLLNRIVNRLNTDLTSELKTVGVPLPFYRVLAVLAAGRGATVNELSVYTIIGQSTLSKALDRMAVAGLVKRETSEEDARVVNISMTEKGWETYRLALPIALRQYERAVADLDQTGRKGLLRGLRQMLDTVRASDFP